MKKLILITITAFALVVTSCKKETEEPKPQSQEKFAKAHIEAEFAADGQHHEETFELNKEYENANSDLVKFETVRYWLSNIRLVKEDGSEWTEASSYRLMEKTPSKLREDFTVENIPVGKYKAIKFAIGVNPERNSSIDSAIAELNPGIGMSWTWNTGYIFFKMEGTFKNKTSGMNDPWKYHVGMNTNYKELTINFPGTLELSQGKTLDLNMLMKPLNVFGPKPNLMDLNTNATLMVQPADQTLKAAENVLSCFELHHALVK